MPQQGAHAQTCGGNVASTAAYTHPPTWEPAPLHWRAALPPFMNLHQEPALPSPSPWATPPQRRHLSLMLNRLLLWAGLQNFNDLQNIVNYVKRHLLHIFM